MDEWILKSYISTQGNIIRQYKGVKYWPMLQRMSLENIMLGERSQTQKDKYCMIPCILNVQNRQIYRDRK